MTDVAVAILTQTMQIKVECWINVYNQNGKIWYGKCFKTRNEFPLGLGMKLLYRIHVRLK